MDCRLFLQLQPFLPRWVQETLMILNISSKQWQMVFNELLDFLFFVYANLYDFTIMTILDRHKVMLRNRRFKTGTKKEPKQTY